MSRTQHWPMLSVIAKLVKSNRPSEKWECRNVCINYLDLKVVTGMKCQIAIKARYWLMKLLWGHTVTGVKGNRKPVGCDRELKDRKY